MKTPNILEVLYKNPNELKPNPKNARTHCKKQVHQMKKSINILGFNNPVLIDSDDVIIAGHGRVLAAIELGLENIPTICLTHMTPEQVRAYIIADNRLAEQAGWDKEILKIELDFLMNLDAGFGFDATITGFDIPDIDLIINSEAIEDAKKEKDDPVDDLPEESEVEKRVSLDDLWQLDNHKLFCGDALKKESFKTLMGQELAKIAFVDMPYNVKIQGNVTKQKHHKEFAYASGEMNNTQFTNFMKTAMTLLAAYSVDGSIHFHCMDWRHMQEILEAGLSAYSSIINLAIWDKITAGMGSYLRSQHELIYIFKNGTAPHINNIELGIYGRYRTNVWKYRGMHASNPEAIELLKLHPTVKPVAMIMDAILDVSKPGDIVLDSFAGSGSTLLAAERTKRKARVIELEPKYADVILYRWEKLTGKKAKLIKNIGDMTCGRQQ
ncbi:MAG: site-specific DNA-methyltransferase [Candidatus Gastranaerophilales bacterium]|nr:site-specific DNA-methyltransferase [Candidatus Gastranaerophilales bacterium]